MFASKVLMASLPNIHLIAMLLTVFTVVYRSRALIPLYLYVMLEGLFYGFTVWWLPYLYIWTILWGAVMLLPKNMKPFHAVPVYMAVCGLHGLLFGTLWAPAQALILGFDFRKTLAWIASGFPYDVAHCIGNCVSALLILPLVKLLLRLEETVFHSPEATGKEHPGE